MWSVRRALSCSRSGLGKPRSAKTLPLPSLTRILLFFFTSVLPFSVVVFCRGGPLFDEFDFFLSRGDAFSSTSSETHAARKQHRGSGPCRPPGNRLPHDAPR